MLPLGPPQSLETTAEVEALLRQWSSGGQKESLAVLACEIVDSVRRYDTD